jgi:hypothetical protein
VSQVSLRERLAAKARKRTIYRVQVDDTAAAERALQVRVAALELKVALRPKLEAEDGFDVAAFDADLVVLRDQVAEARAQHEACYADVELQSLPPDEWDAVLATAPRDADGDVDLDDVRAVLLAASCVDEDLRDVEFWTERLADPAWTKGEKVALNNTLVQLNLNAPAGRQGKG